MARSKDEGENIRRTLAVKWQVSGRNTQKTRLNDTLKRRCSRLVVNAAIELRRRHGGQREKPHLSQPEREMKSKYSILIVSVYRRTYLAFSEFLGQLRLPMDEFCDTELGAKPRARWYPLKGKSGVCDEHRYRGELEIMLEFFNKPAEPSTKTTKATTHSNPFLNVDLRRSALHNLGKGLHFKSLARKEADIIQVQSYAVIFRTCEGYLRL
ncbi:unnamed protein product [Soboliphyme baturini]|uniref:HTH_OrfB_IS605 domain-containing protein n=1 Tax=Soboliphyme baturini TaxID=241478 RepID=A0A183IY21_9BILA|nr:unnamed protein product [Soboliphyme baturini]